MVVVEEKVSSYLSYFHPEDKLIRRWACIRDVFVVFISGQGQSRISTAHRKSLQYIYSHFACYDWVNLLINKHFSYQPAYPFGEWYLSIFLIDSTENVGAHQLTHRVESSSTNGVHRLFILHTRRVASREHRCDSPQTNAADVKGQPSSPKPNPFVHNKFSP